MTDNSPKIVIDNGEPSESEAARRQVRTESATAPRSPAGSLPKSTAPGRKPLFRT
jgi:hypothetical protein